MLSTPLTGVHFIEARAFSLHSGDTGARDRVDDGECEQVGGGGGEIERMNLWIQSDHSESLQEM